MVWTLKPRMPRYSKPVSIETKLVGDDSRHIAQRFSDIELHAAHIHLIAIDDGNGLRYLDNRRIGFRPAHACEWSHSQECFPVSLTTTVGSTAGSSSV